jgi:hypothetical protein
VSFSGKNGKNGKKDKNGKNERKASMSSDIDERRPSIVVDTTSDLDSSSFGIDSSEIDSRKGSTDLTEKLATNACMLLSKVRSYIYHLMFNILCFIFHISCIIL